LIFESRLTNTKHPIFAQGHSNSRNFTHSVTRN